MNEILKSDCGIKIKQTGITPAGQPIFDLDLEAMGK